MPGTKEERIEKQLIRQRAKLESAFRQAQTVNDMIANLSDKKVQIQFFTGARSIDRNKFESILDQIIDLQLDLNSDYQPNYDPLTQFDALQANISVALDKLNSQASSFTNQSSSVSDHNNSVSTNLPPISIKPFHGEIKDWPRFRDLFTSLIINNSRLSQVEKLHYLVASLAERAAEVIQNYSLCDGNFQLAWDSLKERYDSDRVLASHYFEELSKPAATPTKPSLSSLQSFLSKVHDNVTGLKQMNLPGLLDFMFFSLAVKQLDPITRRNFESKQTANSFPTYDSLISFIKNECRLLEITDSCYHATSSISESRRFKPIPSLLKPNPPRKHSVFVTDQFDHSTANRLHCVLCNQTHHLYNCPKFTALSVQERHALVKKNSLCFNCLGSHYISKCKSTRNCFMCNQRHHRLLHFNVTTAKPEVSQEVSSYRNHNNFTSLNKPSVVPPNVSLSSPGPSSGPLALTTLNPTSPLTYQSTILLGTASAFIKNKNGKFIRFRLLIDCGSTATFITKRLVDHLGLLLESSNEKFYGLSSTLVGSTSGAVHCTIMPSISSGETITTRALVIDEILHSLPSVNIPSNLHQYLNHLTLADPDFYRSRPVDLLLGCDLFPLILTHGQPPPPPAPVGMLSTIFGQVILGPVPSCDVQPDLSSTKYSLIAHPRKTTKYDDNNLQTQVERFWQVENVMPSTPLDPADEYCEQHFLETHRRDPEGRYVVAMPFKCDSAKLQFPQSQKIALQRFYSLESRFRKNSALKDVCVSFLKEYESLGHMVKTSRPGKYFIPYFCVFNPLSPTTPARVVFDGSAKGSHISLNQVLHPGPKLQHDVPDILINFRINAYAFTCDISKMYRQILITDSHRAFMHILFRENSFLPLQEYELNTVTYGLTPSSFLSHRVLKQLTQDEGKPYPLAVSAILDHCCVDDILCGSDSLEGLVDLKNQLNSLLAAGGFSLNKWSSNSSDFLLSLQNADAPSNLVIRGADDNSIKVLGLGWNPATDSFFFVATPPPRQSTYTKRQVLSSIARVYDPLGFAAPMIFLFKCILKEIWLSGVGWDEPIPSPLYQQWSECIEQLHSLNDLRIPRCLFPKKSKSYQLLGFCDGSLKGSAAAVYLRVQYEDQSVSVFLIKSKTRVSPSKTQTIPRLELIGALLLSQVLLSLKPFLLKISLLNNNIYLFTDSTIVLAWLRKPPHLLKLFVSNRVTSILENTSIDQWHHVTTDLNISDSASRGLTPHKLCSTPAWFKGPDWAYQAPSLWPISVLDTQSDNQLPEIKLVLLNAPPLENLDPSPPLWLPKFSSLGKMQRVIAYTLRWCHPTRNTAAESPRSLSLIELNSSLDACIRCDQSYYFSKEINCLNNGRPCTSKIQSLSPFIDASGLIRVGGRLANSNLSFNAKHPVLISNKSHLCILIIEHFHKLYLHAGPRTLDSLLAKRFWILNSRYTIRKCIYNCIRCAKLRATTFSPLMGNLPSSRVTPSRPFLNCGVDLAGPFILKESLRRNARTYKAYFALFVCFAVKAVHIEPLTSLSAESFIAALQRFVSRRGLPSTIYSDQATNFKGACRQISEIVTFLRSSVSSSLLQTCLNADNITFLFNVPRAPHMSGVAESNIKNIKFHLTRVIGKQVLTFEEWFTILTRVEAILNSRPLCAISTSPDDLQSLTPGHFLIGDSLLGVPEEDLTGTPANRLSRWQLVIQATRSLWKRWEREYLHTLQNKGKWFSPDTNISVGQLVWIKEDNAHPLSYPLGRIISVHPGKDQVVRAATVRTASGTYLRPTRKLAPLPNN